MLLETIVPGAGIVAASEEEIAARLGDLDHPLTLHGHSHIQRCVTLADGRRVANPGSVGLPSHLTGVSSGNAAQYALLEDGEVTLLTVDYDVEAAARRAEATGGPGWWAHALREAPPR